MQTKQRVTSHLADNSPRPFSAACCPRNWLGRAPAAAAVTGAATPTLAVLRCGPRCAAGRSCRRSCSWAAAAGACRHGRPPVCSRAAHAAAALGAGAYCSMAPRCRAVTSTASCRTPSRGDCASRLAQGRCPSRYEQSNQPRASQSKLPASESRRRVQSVFRARFGQWRVASALLSSRSETIIDLLGFTAVISLLEICVKNCRVTSSVSRSDKFGPQ